MTAQGSTPGRVWAHVGQPFHEQEFDVVVIGAGRMGAAAALYLKRHSPAASMLLVEEGGLPNEEGATILAPGVWSGLHLTEQEQVAARWTREQLKTALGDVQFHERPLVELSEREQPGSVPTAELLSRFPMLAELVNPEHLPNALLDDQAATFRPSLVALNAAQQSIRAGVNLLLNTRARLTPHGLKLERLTVTNTHQIVTHEVKEVQARLTVIAAGASGPALIEHGAGLHTRHGRVYVQYPRLNVPGAPESLVLRVPGLILRPLAGAFTLVPALRHPDPHGYAPVGGHLTGVPTGLRRELLEELVSLMDSVPVLATDALQVGRSLTDVPGAWLALPGGQAASLPTWEELSPALYLLLGGPQADTLGLAVADELARHLSGRL